MKHYLSIIVSISADTKGAAVKQKYLWILSAMAILMLVALLYRPTKVWHTITLGASLPLNGINKELGKDVMEGANTYFKYTNDTGGIRHRRIEFISYDDKYEPQNTLKNTHTLIEKDHAFALFGFVGTPTTKKIMPVIKDIPFVAPYTGAAFLRNSEKQNIVNFRSSYGEEIENIIQYLTEKKHIQRFAIFYQNDDYGIAGYNATVKALKKRKTTLVSEGTYKRNTLSIKHALQEIKTASPEAIILVGAYKPSARFIRQWRQNSDPETLFAPISFVNADALIRELGGEGTHIYFSLTVPSYDDSKLKIANTYRRLLARYYPESTPSYASFESFLAAKAAVAALKSIHVGITREGFVSALKRLKRDTLGNIPISYRNTQLLNQVYLSVYKDGAFHLVEEKSSTGEQRR